MSVRTTTRLRSQAIPALVIGVGLLLVAAGATIAIIWCAVAGALQSAQPVALYALPVCFSIVIVLYATALPADILLAYGKRSLAHLAAMRGAVTSLSESRIQPHPERAPDILANTLVLDVAYDWRDRRVFPYLSAGLWLVGFALTIVWIVKGTMEFGWIGTLGAADTAAVVWVHLLRVYRPRACVARSITADPAGLHWKTLLGGTGTMAWHDARLLEVTREDKAGPHVSQRSAFTLYGERAIVRWSDKLT